MYYVYVLKHDRSGKIYIGQTVDLEKRLLRHNGILPSKPKGYTNINRKEGSWKVVYKELCETRSEAIKREKALKSHKGRDWLKEVLAR